MLTKDQAIEIIREIASFDYLTLGALPVTPILVAMGMDEELKDSQVWEDVRNLAKALGLTSYDGDGEVLIVKSEDSVIADIYHVYLDLCFDMACTSEKKLEILKREFNVKAHIVTRYGSEGYPLIEFVGSKEDLQLMINSILEAFLRRRLHHPTPK